MCPQTLPFPFADAPAGSEVGEDRREGGASRDDEDSGSDGEDSGSDDGSTLSGVYGRSKRAARAAEAQVRPHRSFRNIGW